MRSQHGMTLVELLIAMSVTAAIMVGIAGVVQVGERVASHWTAPVQDATATNQLADWLHQDSHRYIVCMAEGSELRFCQPDDRTRTPMVSYVLESSTQPTSCTSSADSPCDLVRKDSTTRFVLVRRLQGDPSFYADCEPGNVTTGTIHVYNVYVLDHEPQDINVVFRAPKGSCS